VSPITIDLFKKAVAQYFEPIAHENNLPLVRPGEKLYEIPSIHFVMRIRFDVGAHTKSINATLIQSHQMPGDIEEGCLDELGVGVIAGYNGVEVRYVPWEQTEEGFLQQAKAIAIQAKQFAVPYLLGQKSDWNYVRAYIQEKIDEDVERIKAYKFPPNVQKRWHLPADRPPDEK
jgi:hypothetical protein